MQDIETKSLWSQISGECINGTMEGRNLTQYPASHLTYSEFKKLYPQGILLKKDEKGPKGSRYNDYFTDKNKLGIFDRADNFTRLDGKDIVYGLRLPGGDYAISEDYLKRNTYALFPDQSPPIVVTYNLSGNAAAAFSLDGVISENVKSIQIKEGIIAFSDSKWDAGTGRSISGKDNNLSPVPIVTGYWFAWASFFPETELIK